MVLVVYTQIIWLKQMMLMQMMTEMCDYSFLLKFPSELWQDDRESPNISW